MRKLMLLKCSPTLCTADRVVIEFCMMYRSEDMFFEVAHQGYLPLGVGSLVLKTGSLWRPGDRNFFKHWIHAKNSSSVICMLWNFSLGLSLDNINDEGHYLTRAGSSPTSDLGKEVVGLSTWPLVLLSSCPRIKCWSGFPARGHLVRTGSLCCVYQGLISKPSQMAVDGKSVHYVWDCTLWEFYVIGLNFVSDLPRQWYLSI